MKYEVKYTHLSESDLEDLSKTARKTVRKLIGRVSQNPLPQNEGGYGKPLGHKHGINLTGCCKIVLKKLGIRVVYELVRTETTMEIIVVAARADSEVYSIAAKRIAERGTVGD
jgi:mRNA interferase RelE/StbE